MYPNAVVPNLGPPDVLGLQLPEAFTTTSAGQDFWELKSKNICRPKVGDQCCIAVVLNLCYSDAFELQLPETLVRTAGGEGFWELQSKTPE